VALIAMGVYGFLWPREAWLKFTAWQYKNAELHEPSEAAYLTHRYLSVVTVLAGAVVLIGSIGLMVHSYYESLPEAKARKAEEVQKLIDWARQAGRSK
jgi:hypothetical protein